MKTEKAMFGAGCFWGVEEVFRTTNGVLRTEVGYAGGNVEDPSYEQVCAKNTGHAEVVYLEYDPEIVSFNELLDIFWSNHNPTQLNRQGPDIGEQYRSVIFYFNDDQLALAEASKKKLQDSDRYKKDLVTAIEPYTSYYKAEDYHQQYLKKRGLNVCH